jgi:hypothetical protein
MEFETDEDVTVATRHAVAGTIAEHGNAAPAKAM